MPYIFIDSCWIIHIFFLCSHKRKEKFQFVEYFFFITTKYEIVLGNGTSSLINWISVVVLIKFTKLFSGVSVHLPLWMALYILSLNRHIPEHHVRNVHAKFGNIIKYFHLSISHSAVIAKLFDYFMIWMKINTLSIVQRQCGNREWNPLKMLKSILSTFNLMKRMQELQSVSLKK